MARRTIALIPTYGKTKEEIIKDALSAYQMYLDKKAAAEKKLKKLLKKTVKQ